MRIPRLLPSIAILVAACSSDPMTTGAANVTTISVQDFFYAAATVSVKVGTVVQWTNHGPSAHTATSDDGVWDSGQLSAPTGNSPYVKTGAVIGIPDGIRPMYATAPGSFQFTFNTVGTYKFHCLNHPPASYPTFVGTVTVTN
jgi:plastocyanin